MRKDIVKEAESELEGLRARNEQIEETRRREISAGYPDVQALVLQREEMIYGSLRGALRGDKPAGDLTIRMEEINSRIHEELKKSGLPENYLEPVYSCGKCRDTGYVGYPVKEMCSCLTGIYQRKLREATGLAQNSRETFESFDETLFPDTVIEGTRLTQRYVTKLARNACEEWANQYPGQKTRDLVLSGQSGLGKTFLLRCIASRLISRGYNALPISAYSLQEILRKSYFGQDDRAQELTEAEVLLIDDLGTEPFLQNITIEQLFNLINERQNRGLSTIISTNLNMKELRERYTERIMSRLSDTRTCNFIRLVGQDIRHGRGSV